MGVSAQACYESNVESGLTSFAVCANCHRKRYDQTVVLSVIFLESKLSANDVCQLDKPGNEALLRAQKILIEKGLFDSHLVDQAYNQYGPARSRSRAAIAWGTLQFATQVSNFLVVDGIILLTTCPASTNST